MFRCNNVSVRTELGPPRGCKGMYTMHLVVTCSCADSLIYPSDSRDSNLETEM